MFVGFGLGSSGHAGEFLIKPKVILDGDGRQRLRFPFDLYSFFRFHGLMQTIAPTAASHQAASVFINDDDLVLLDDILDIFLVKTVGLQQLRNGVNLLCFGFEIGLQLVLHFEPFVHVLFGAIVDLVKSGNQIR